jgi:predicted histidine transporter YuiF (NhaC family)
MRKAIGALSLASMLLGATAIAAPAAGATETNVKKIVECLERDNVWVGTGHGLECFV